MTGPFILIPSSWSTQYDVINCRELGAYIRGVGVGRLFELLAQYLVALWHSARRVRMACGVTFRACQARNGRDQTSAVPPVDVINSR